MYIYIYTYIHSLSYYILSIHNKPYTHTYIHTLHTYIHNITYIT